MGPRGLRRGAFRQRSHAEDGQESTPGLRPHEAADDGHAVPEQVVVKSGAYSDLCMPGLLGNFMTFRDNFGDPIARG